VVDQNHAAVTGVVGEVRTDAPQLGIRLSAAQMEATPLLNRRITYFLLGTFAGAALLMARNAVKLFAPWSDREWKSRWYNRC
jgi:hypothetical protein